MFGVDETSETESTLKPRKIKVIDRLMRSYFDDLKYIQTTLALRYKYSKNNSQYVEKNRGFRQDSYPSLQELVTLEKHAPGSLHCKHCGSDRVIKRGWKNDQQMYGCKTCGRRFLQNNKFPRMRIGKKVIAIALDLYFEGVSLRKLARQIMRIFDVKVTHAAILGWIQKYAPIVKKFVKSLKPNANHRWHHDETWIKVSGTHQFYWDLIDENTKFILSAFLSGRKRGNKQARKMYLDAKKYANGLPTDVYCDNHRVYERAFRGVFHGNKKIGFHSKVGIRSKPNNNSIERFHGTLKDRLRVMRGLQNPKALLDAFIIHYNFVRPHQSLNGMTPAQKAGIHFPDFKGWTDLIRWGTYHSNKTV